jgi:hypothetical protein
MFNCKKTEIKNDKISSFLDYLHRNEFVQSDLLELDRDGERVSIVPNTLVVSRKRYHYEVSFVYEGKSYSVEFVYPHMRLDEFKVAW